MDGWTVASAVAPWLPRTLPMVVGGAVLIYMIVTGDYRLIWSAMASGVDEVTSWTWLYDALTRIVTL